MLGRDRRRPPASASGFDSPGRSTRTTSAPSSASIMPANGVGPMPPSSTTRMPASGPAAALTPATPRTASSGGRSPRIVATMSTTRRVARTSWARNTVAPSQAATAVAARVPSSRSSAGRSRVSPMKSLRDSACSTG